MRALALVAAALAAGCSSPPTEAFVVVTTHGIRVPVDVDAVRIQVSNRDGTTAFFDNRYPLCHPGLTEACLSLPITMTVVPGAQQPSDSVRVRVDALRDTVPVIANAAVFTFVHKQRLRLDFVLYADCLDNVSCEPQDLACGPTGACEAIMPEPFSGAPDLGTGGDQGARDDLGARDLAGEMPERCGQAGDPCCPGDTCNTANLACAGGGCTTCGAIGQPCCAGDLCPVTGACQASSCVACGAVGQPCCAGDTCPTAGTCAGGTCQCGAIGQRCCSGNTCPSSGTCSGGFCVGGGTCGASGQACCPPNLCNNGLSCNGSSCVACGGSGQPCCAGTCTSGFRCNSGICNPCGGAAQQCCAGGVCSNPLGCNSMINVCEPCGLIGQICCEMFTCAEGVCNGMNRCACGLLGQPCCANAMCTQGQCNGTTCVLSDMGTGGFDLGVRDGMSPPDFSPGLPDGGF